MGLRHDQERLDKAAARFPGSARRLTCRLYSPISMLRRSSSRHRSRRIMTWRWQALGAGKHVFVEKPMATSVAQCDEMIAAAQAPVDTHGRHTFVYSPPVRLVKKVIDSGELGEIYFVTSSRVNLGLHQRDVSVVWDLAPHDLSILYYWLSEAPRSVSVLGRSCVGNGIPMSPSSTCSSVGIVANARYRGSRRSSFGGRSSSAQEDAYVRRHRAVEKVKIFDRGVDFRDPESFGEFQLSYRTGDIISPRIESSEPLYLEASHFLECVKSGVLPTTDVRGNEPWSRRPSAPRLSMQQVDASDVRLDGIR